MVVSPGTFSLTESTLLLVEGGRADVRAVGEYLSTWLTGGTGHRFAVEFSDRRVAPDGAIFVVDARHILYELAPDTLAPLRRSAPLATAIGVSDVHLVATADDLWLSSAALGATQRLRRRDFQLLDRIERFGPLAVDPVVGSTIRQ